MKLPFRSRLRRSTTLKVIHHLLDDRRQKRRYERGELSTTSGTILQGKTVEESIAYIEREFRDYLEYGRVPSSELPGKRVLVVGPGDNLGVALLFLAGGARKVTCIDKFESLRNPEHLARVYTAMRGRIPPEQRDRFDRAFSLLSDSEFRHDPEHLEYITGVGLEECGNLFPAFHFDLIVSRAVLEHLFDPDRAFAAMDSILVAGGRLVHRIDLRDHEMFSTEGRKHPLTFLTFPDRLWRSMTYHSGKPNRRMFPYYRRKMEELGYEATLYVTHVFGKEGDLTPHPPTLRRGIDYDDSHLRLVRKIRWRLARRFRTYTDEELLISGIFLSAGKPPAVSAPPTSSNSRE